MDINIKTIPNEEQRYPTIGDWWFTPEGNLELRVSNLGDWKMEAAIIVHELCEVLLCKARGIKQEDVDNFDKQFEENRPEDNEDEPGDDPAAPYRKEHFFATSIERLLCAELGIDWKEYEDKINSL